MASHIETRLATDLIARDGVDTRHQGPNLVREEARELRWLGGEEARLADPSGPSGLRLPEQSLGSVRRAGEAGGDAHGGDCSRCGIPEGSRCFVETPEFFCADCHWEVRDERHYSSTRVFCHYCGMRFEGDLPPDVGVRICDDCQYREEDYLAYCNQIDGVAALVAEVEDRAESHRLLSAVGAGAGPEEDSEDEDEPWWVAGGAPVGVAREEDKWCCSRCGGTEDRGMILDLCLDCEFLHYEDPGRG